MLACPDELVIEIGSQVQLDGDLNALAQTSRRLHACLDPLLYRRSANRALLWAASRDEERVPDPVLRRALASGATNIVPALTASASRGHAQTTQILVDAFTPLRQPIPASTQTFEPALLRAALGGHAEVVRILLDSAKLANVNRKDANGRTALSFAAQEGFLPVVRLLLATPGIKPDIRCRLGLTALSYAAEGGHEAIVELLLATGEANVNSSSEEAWTPLHFAAAGGHAGVVALLLATGVAHVDETDLWGTTPLSLARMRKHASVARLLEDWQQEHPEVESRSW